MSFSTHSPIVATKLSYKLGKGISTLKIDSFWKALVPCATAFALSACDGPKLRQEGLASLLGQKSSTPVQPGNSSGGGGPTNQITIGNFDGISSNIASGWCYDPDHSSSAIQYAGYMDGSPTSGQPAFQGTTNIVRSDVNSAHSVTGAHGFSATIPANFLNGTFHNLYIYCLDGESGWTSLQQSPRSIGDLGGVVSRIRVKNPSNLERLSPVIAVISFPKGAILDQADLDSKGFTVGGTPAVATRMEGFWSNGQPQFVALARVVSLPIHFSPYEEKVLEIRADHAALPGFEVPAPTAALGSALEENFFVEAQDLNGNIFRSRPGGPFSQARILESTSIQFVVEIRSRFLGTSGQVWNGFFATYYLTFNSQSTAIQAKIRIANDYMSIARMVSETITLSRELVLQDSNMLSSRESDLMAVDQRASISIISRM